MSKRYLQELVDPAEFAAWTQARDAALIALDLTWVRNMMDFDADDFTVLAGIHKARYNTPSIPEVLRHESAAWLRQRGLSDLDGVPLLPPGQLPEGADR